MPRVTKEQNNELNKEKTTANKTTKKVATSSTSKKSNKSTNVAAKNTTKKSTTKKADIKTSTTKKTTTKKSSTKKSSSSKPKKTVTKSTLKKKVNKAPIVEYYDLPYRYNQTVVKLLAQTPDTLFIYWDISDEDRENYKKTYGENFFENTKPVLIVHNTTMNYSFEVDINDFANSWYLHINDSKCNYHIELGRRVITNTPKLNNNEYVYISSSNKIESPNDRVLIDKTQKMVYFRNIKTNKETSKDISTFSFIRNMGKIYNIYDIYKQIYKNENIDEISNPSSNYKGDK